MCHCPLLIAFPPVVTLVHKSFLNWISIFPSLRARRNHEVLSADSAYRMTPSPSYVRKSNSAENLFGKWMLQWQPCGGEKVMSSPSETSSGSKANWFPLSILDGQQTILQRYSCTYYSSDLQYVALPACLESYRSPGHAGGCSFVNRLENTVLEYLLNTGTVK